MALSVLNNIASLTAQNNLAVTNNNLNNTLLQLSSGSRINSGADDPAGLSIVNGLQANITALTQSAQNATDGVGQLQVADGALSQVTTLLNRAVTLSTEAANGGLTSDQFAAITNEYGSIVSEIDRIGNATNFNGNPVFSSTTAPNLSQAVTMAQSSLSANEALTAGTTTSVQLGNEPAFTYTAGASADTLIGATPGLESTTGITNTETMTVTNTAGSYAFTAAAGNDTVGALIDDINGSGLGLTAALTSGGQFEVTSSDGPISISGNTVAEVGSVQATNTIQDLINGINGSGLGVTASLVSGVQNKNQLQSTDTAALTGASVVVGTLVLNSGAQGASGAYGNTYTFVPGTTKDPLTGGATSTVQGLIDSINDSGTPFHAFLQNGKLEITDGSYSGNISATFSGTIGGDAATFANPAATTQLEITDPLNRANLTVNNNDPLLGYVANTASNPVEGGNADSFVAPGQTNGSGGASVFISDGDVTNPTYNTINVQVGLLNGNQIGNNTTALSTQNLGTASGAASALTVINTAISDVAAMRGTIGAGINRLNSATNVINTQVQNLTSAQSSIQDANVGQVVANLSKYQILEQTGISALAQANQNQQAVLKLLQ
ncbi:MAG TPA: flagellin [Terriglobia bacterium]|nr:flagellin [Terriglobia bacterium]